MQSGKVNTGALYSLFLRLDFRDKRSVGFKKLIGVLIAYFFANFFLSFGNFRNFDEVSFVILSMSTNAFFLSFILLNDFISLFLVKSESETIYALPIKQEDIFLSKFFAAYSFMVFYAAAIILPQVIFFYQYNENIIGTLAFLYSVFLFNIFIISCLALFYIFILRYFVKFSYTFIYMINICFLVYVFYSSTVRGRAMGEGRSSVFSYSFVDILPQTLFAKGVSEPVWLIILTLITIVAAGLFYLLLRKNYSRITSGVQAINNRAKNRSAVNPFTKLANAIDKIITTVFVRNHLQRASYYLMRNQLSNSRVFKLRYFVFLLMPLVFTGIAVFSGLAGTVIFEKGDMSSYSNVLILSPSILFIYVLCARLIISNTRIADTNSNDSEWIYRSLPVGGVVQMRLGILKFIMSHLLIPMIIVVGLLLSYRMDPLSIILNLLFATAGVFFISSILYRFDKYYPFTQDSSKMDSASKFIEVLFTIVLALIIFISQLFIFKNIIFIFTSIPVLFLLGGIILRTQRT